MRFPSLCLRLFASGVVLATAFSLQAPLTKNAAPAGTLSILVRTPFSALSVEPSFGRRRKFLPTDEAILPSACTAKGLSFVKATPGANAAAPVAARNE